MSETSNALGMQIPEPHVDTWNASMERVTDALEKIDAFAGDMATIERSPSAGDHAVGEFLLWAGRLYRVIDEITEGDVLSVNVNVEHVDIGTNLERALETNDHFWADSDGAHISSDSGSLSVGDGTLASSDNQIVIGKYNIEDTDGTYAIIIGNGTADNARSNALTVDWDGNLDIAGKLSVGKLSWAGTTDNLVATATDNDQEWSIDLVPNGHTGTFWHVWTATKGTMLRCDVDSGDVTIPYTAYINRIRNKYSSGTRGTTPSSDQWINSIEYVDQNNARVGIIETARLAAGRSELWLRVSDNTGQVQGGFCVRQAIGGTTGYNLIHDAGSGWLEVPRVLRVAGLTQYLNSGIEFYPPANNSGYGGTLDFHYNQSTADYTSRIWETDSGRIQVLGASNFEKRGAGSSNGIWTIATDMTRDEQRSAQQDAPAFVIGDTSYNIMGRMCVRHESGGTKNHWNMIEINRVVNGTSIWNSIAVGINKNGSRIYSVNDPAAFRSAIAEAGTTTATLVSAYVHTDYGSLTCVRKGNIVFYNVNLHVKAFSGRKQIATVPAGYRPTAALYALSTTGGYVIISTGGDVQYDGGSDKYLYATTTGIRA